MNLQFRNNIHRFLGILKFVIFGFLYKIGLKNKWFHNFKRSIQISLESRCEKAKGPFLNEKKKNVVYR